MQLTSVRSLTQNSKHKSLLSLYYLAEKQYSHHLQAMRNKQQYTDIFIKNLDHVSIPAGSELVFFWQNVRIDGGLRLTDSGYNCLVSDLNLEKYDIKLWDDDHVVQINFKFLLDLDKHLECPYYVRLGRWPLIILFDEKVYFWACMHGDFQKFLDGYKIST